MLVLVTILDRQTSHSVVNILNECPLNEFHCIALTKTIRHFNKQTIYESNINKKT